MYLPAIFLNTKVQSTSKCVWYPLKNEFSIFNWCSGVYEKIVLEKPIITLGVVAICVTFFGYHIPNFQLDASADSLVLEDDRGLNYYRSIRARYGSDDYLILTYTPHGDLFSTAVLTDLKKLRDALVGLDHVESVISILDVPLIHSPQISLAELGDNVPTLESPETDTHLARAELLSSPLYQNLLVSPDGNTTALRVQFRPDEGYQRLLEEQKGLKEKRLEMDLTKQESDDMSAITKQLKTYTARQHDRHAKDIKQIRSIMDTHQGHAELHLGGVPMIVTDSIAFIRHDLQVFGMGVLGFVIVILTIVFRKLRWLVLAMMICMTTGMIMVGLLGFMGWRVTIVSSNFLSLLLILTLSLTIHLIVRYRELHAGHTDRDQRTLVLRTVRSKAVPCFYTAITTIVAFGSLVFSAIRPVIDFGWMMVIGILVAFVLVFTIFPAGLMLTQVGTEPSRQNVVRKFTSLPQMLFLITGTQHSWHL